MRKKVIFVLARIVILALLIGACGKDAPTQEIETIEDSNGGTDMSYKQITMEEAKAIFKTPGDYLIVDVRRPDEFASGHIPGAINVVNEEIGSEQPVDLPDLNQTLYVYCRSGNRSKQAAAKLATIGYTKIIEFGGIMDWTGEIEK